jgi:hypothetical protein
MAEKAFKVPSLDLVGGSHNLTASNSVLNWGTDIVAMQGYVDNAVANVAVNVYAIAGDGLLVTPGSSQLAIHTGNHVYLEYDALSVNVNSIASGLAGNGLAYNGSTQQLDLNTGRALYVNSDTLAVNVKSLITGFNGGSAHLIYKQVQDSFDVNVNALAGYGLLGSGGGAGTIGIDSTIVATKSYVDGVAQGLDIKESVKFASTGDVTIADLYEGNTAANVGTSSTLAKGDRILLKNQTNKNENGIWEVGLTSGSAARTQDADSFAKLNKGSFVFVESGDNAGKGYVVTFTDESGALGAVGTENSWSQFSEAGSYITNSSAPFFVQAGNLSLNTTPNLYVTGTNKLNVNVNALSGSGLIGLGGGDGTLAVDAGQHLDINATSGSLQVNLITMAGQHLQVNGGNNGLAVNVQSVAAELHPYNYGAASFFITNGSATQKTVVGQAATTSSNSWVTIASIDFGGTANPNMFSADVVMTDGIGTRTSKISGTVDELVQVATYTEYAIVDQGTAAITDADVQVVYNSQTQMWNLQIKSDIAVNNELRGAASITAVGYAI